MNLLNHLRSLEESLLHPEVRKDAAALRNLLAPAFLEFGSSGRVFDREQIIHDLAQEASYVPPVITGYTLVASTGTWALTIFRATRPAPASAVSLRSSTWVLLEDRWQLLFHQGTPSTPEVS